MDALRIGGIKEFLRAPERWRIPHFLPSEILSRCCERPTQSEATPYEVTGVSRHFDGDAFKKLKVEVSYNTY